VHDTQEYALRAFSSGAVGYLPKSAASSELEVAIERVMHGERYFSPSIEPIVSQKPSKGGHAGLTTPVELTPRQREVLTLVTQGYSTKDIARTLGISVKTVETHRAQLMERLGIHDVAGLVRYAIRTGIVKLDD
jgi:DNA-binding NarL/FixJ family response regulator